MSLESAYKQQAIINSMATTPVLVCHVPFSISTMRGGG